LYICFLDLGLSERLWHEAFLDKIPFHWPHGENVTISK